MVWSVLIAFPNNYSNMMKVVRVNMLWTWKKHEQQKWVPIRTSNDCPHATNLENIKIIPNVWPNWPPNIKYNYNTSRVCSHVSIEKNHSKLRWKILKHMKWKKIQKETKDPSTSSPNQTWTLALCIKVSAWMPRRCASSNNCRVFGHGAATA